VAEGQDVDRYGSVGAAGVARGCESDDTFGAATIDEQPRRWRGKDKRGKDKQRYKQPKRRWSFFFFILSP
jgi:hypothetical protein